MGRKQKTEEEEFCQAIKSSMSGDLRPMQAGPATGIAQPGLGRGVVWDS